MKINAILLNPTIDQIYEIENFYVGGTFKVQKILAYPVGKAISFSLGVRELKEDENIIKVIAFIGKNEISLYSKFLSTKNIEYKLIEIEGTTRSNKTINDPINKTTTHIREQGFVLNNRNIQELFEIIDMDINKNDYCVFCGSIPPGVESDIYFNLINSCKRKGCICILDSSDKPLTEGIKANPNIIKPNLIELSQILNSPYLNDLDFSNLDDSIKILTNKTRILLKADLEIILLTLGQYGALMISNESMLYGKILIKNTIDTVGSGDSFLAGFVLKHFQKKDFKTCFKYALACGAANTLIQGPGIFKKTDVLNLLNKIELKKVN